MDKDGTFWSLVAWGGGVVAFILAYVIVRSLFGAAAPDGLIFGGVAFIFVGGVLTAVLGPRDAGVPAYHGAAPATHPVATPVARATHEPEASVPAAAAGIPVAPVPEASTGGPAAAAPGVTEGRSERVSEAAREAARLAADLETPVATAKRPERLDAPRGGTADDLKRIKGIGPKLEDLLNNLGYYHFDQIAAWTPEEIAWVDTNIEDFRGRATRDDWVGQARLLASGAGTEFSQRVDRGEVY
jgi:NADH-quinone oxidoreductase subunit E